MRVWAMFFAGAVIGAGGLCAWAGSPREELAAEVRGKGWIVFSARSANGSWDLFVMRPDGSERRALTDTPEVEEAAPRYSPDGRKLLYRVAKRGTVLDHDKWGFSGALAVADWDGSNQRLLGGEGELPWASWSPDGRQIASLGLKGIVIVDAETGEVVRRMDRRGMFQQMYWSPDGRWFCGVANYRGEVWTLVRMDAESGETNEMSSLQSCTPDWFADSRRVIYSCRPAGQRGNRGWGWTQLWVANAAGGGERLLYGEDGIHVYGGATSPDDRYVLFTRLEEDGGGAEKAGAPMHLIRLEDGPMIRGRSTALRRVHAGLEVKDGPILLLGRGWEPHWTYAELEYK